MILTTCEKLGVPPSQFMGRPTVTTTVVTGKGKDKERRTTTASPWTPEDQALMMAWREYQDGLCKDCGHPKETAWDATRGTWFQQVDEITCWACTAAREPNRDTGVREPKTFPVVVDTFDPTYRP